MWTEATSPRSTSCGELGQYLDIEKRRRPTLGHKGLHVAAELGPNDRDVVTTSPDRLLFKRGQEPDRVVATWSEISQASITEPRQTGSLVSVHPTKQIGGAVAARRSFPSPSASCSTRSCSSTRGTYRSPSGRSGERSRDASKAIQYIDDSKEIYRLIAEAVAARPDRPKPPSTACLLTSTWARPRTFCNATRPTQRILRLW